MNSTDLKFFVLRRSFLAVGIFLLFLFVCKLIVVFFVVTKCLLWRRKVSHLLPSSGIRFINVLGNLIDLPMTEQARNGYSILIHLHQLFSGYSKLFINEKLFCLWVFCHPLVVLAKAEAVQAVFGQTKMINKGAIYDWFRKYLGNGVVSSDGDRWKSRRKMLNPCFRNEILKEFFPVLNEHSRILVECLKGETNKDFPKIIKPLSFCTLDMLGDTILGISTNSQTSRTVPPLLHSLKWCFRLIMERLATIYLWPDFIYFSTKSGKDFKRHVKIVLESSKSLIQKEKQKFLRGDFSANNSKRKSIIHLILEHHLQVTDFTEEDVKDELLAFLVAGQDATAIASTWTLYMLGLYPEVQAKVHKELDLVFGEDIHRHVTEEDIKDLKYLDCVIKETQRLYPTVPMQARYVTEDTTVCGYTIPKGTTCAVITSVLHRDEEVFPDPENFDPDRFLLENSSDRNPFAFIPFSAGPRSCIGKKLAMMAQMIMTSAILRNYTVESLDQRDQILTTLTLATSTSKPIRIRIRPRY